MFLPLGFEVVVSYIGGCHWHYLTLFIYISFLLCIYFSGPFPSLVYVTYSVDYLLECYVYTNNSVA